MQETVETSNDRRYLCINVTLKISVICVNTFIHMTGLDVYDLRNSNVLLSYSNHSLEMPQLSLCAARE